MSKEPGSSHRELAAVDLQWNLIGLLEELLRNAQYCELVVRRLDLRQAGLHDENANRYPAGAAEVSDLDQSIPGADLQASSPAAFDTQCLAFQ